MYKTFYIKILDDSQPWRKWKVQICKEPNTIVISSCHVANYVFCSVYVVTFCGVDVGNLFQMLWSYPVLLNKRKEKQRLISDSVSFWFEPSNRKKNIRESRIAVRRDSQLTINQLEAFRSNSPKEILNSYNFKSLSGLTYDMKCYIWQYIVASHVMPDVGGGSGSHRHRIHVIREGSKSQHGWQVRDNSARLGVSPRS